MSAYTPRPTCGRCGLPYYEVVGNAPRCHHTNTAQYNITPDHALRIQAAYTFGKRFNPDHDETNYFIQTLGLDADVVTPLNAMLKNARDGLDGPAAGLGRRLPVTVGGAPAAGPPPFTKD